MAADEFAVAELAAEEEFTVAELVEEEFGEEEFAVAELADEVGLVAGAAGAHASSNAGVSAAPTANPVRSMN